MVQVSIHAPARGATRSRSRRWSTARSFNPRARAGRDMADPVGQGASALGFQSTRPRGARLCGFWPFFCGVCCFNPRARAGRDEKDAKEVVTDFEFQSTRPRGARPAFPVARQVTPMGFNPRARAGRDGREERSGEGVRPVSIHAPARGATSGFRY